MAFSRINYREPKQSTYKSIDFTYRQNGKDVTKSFNTGNVIVDYYNYMLFLQELPDEWYKENHHISGSSLWDHFFMDGNKYKESYFDPESGKFIDWRKALSDGDHKTYMKCCDNEYPRVIHLACHKDFHAVKKYYKKKTKKK